MVEKKLIPFVRGFVTVELINGNIGELINTAQAAGVSVWDISWQKNGHAVCSLYVRDIRRFRKISRQAGARFRILERHGFPFFLVRLEKRVFFSIGFLLFIAGLIVASNVVWDIDVKGNETIPEKEILRIAREAGVYKGQFQFRLQDYDTIQRQLLLELSDASWVGMRVQGTRAIITVVEKKRVDAKEQQEDKSGPYDLVADRSATIADLSGVETGRVLVDYSEIVKKGQILVSGMYGSEDDDSGEIIGARGSVIGETWYETTVSVPLTQTRKTYTGEREVSTYPFIGQWSLSIPFLEKVPFEQYETIRHIKTMHIREWKLPFGLVETEYLESRRVNIRRTEQEAENLAMERAKEDVLRKLGPDGKIISTKVLQKEVNGGKVLLKLLFTVHEDIAKQQPMTLEKSEEDT